MKLEKIRVYFCILMVLPLQNLPKRVQEEALIMRDHKNLLRIKGNKTFSIATYLPFVVSLLFRAILWDRINFMRQVLWVFRFYKYIHTHTTIGKRSYYINSKSIKSKIHFAILNIILALFFCGKFSFLIDILFSIYKVDFKKHEIRFKMKNHQRKEIIIRFGIFHKFILLYKKALNFISSYVTLQNCC